MNNSNFIHSSLNLVILTIISLLFLWGAFKIIDVSFTRKFGLKRKDKAAYLIYVCGNLLSFAFLLSSAAYPIQNALKFAQKNNFSLYDTLKYPFLILLSVAIFSTFICFLGMAFTYFLTKDSEQFNEEITGERGIALVASTILLGIAMFVREALIIHLDLLIPYPPIPNVF